MPVRPSAVLCSLGTTPTSRRIRVEGGDGGTVFVGRGPVVDRGLICEECVEVDDL